MPPTRRSARSSPHCAYVGGAFGGKDHTIYPLYVALGRPVLARTARCASPTIATTSSSSASSATPSTCAAGWRSTATSGRITAFAADQDLDGGGLANLSAAVAFVGATASIGIYDVPKVDVTTVARHSRAVTAGSMRGFGALQTMTALEVMIDEAAASLGRDPVAFRKANLLKTGGKTMVGNVVSGALRSGEVLDRLASKPLWTGRAAEKARRAATAPDKAYGVGLACVSTVFGSGSDPAFALVEIDPAGRITLTSQAVEIGTGIATALAVRVADKLGAAADEVKLGVLDGWDVLGLVAPDDPFTITREQQDDGGEESALGSRRRAGHHRVDLGPRPHRGRRRGGERHPALRPLAGGAGDLVGRAVRRPGRRRIRPPRRRALCRRPLDRGRHGAARASPPRRQGARDGPRRRRDGARLQSLGLGAGELRSSRRPLRGRDRRARGQIRQWRIAGAQGADDHAAAISASIASR